MLEEVKADVLGLIELYESTKKELAAAESRNSHLQRQIRDKDEQIERLNKRLNALSFQMAKPMAEKEIKRLIAMLDECIASLSK